MIGRLGGMKESSIHWKKTDSPVPRCNCYLMARRSTGSSLYVYTLGVYYNFCARFALCFFVCQWRAANERPTNKYQQRRSTEVSISHVKSYRTMLFSGKASNHIFVRSLPTSIESHLFLFNFTPNSHIFWGVSIILCIIYGVCLMCSVYVYLYMLYVYVFLLWFFLW